MPRLVLMRHAEARLAPGQRDGDLFSVRDLPLSPQGHAQATAVADAFAGAPVDAVYASPARRAVETAEVVARAHALKVTVVDDLLELPVAPRGLDHDAVLARIVALARALRTDPDPLLDGGRRFRAEVTRFADAVDAVTARDAHPVVVAHGLTNRAWLARALGMPAHAMFRLAQGHACANVVDVTDDRAVVTAVNLPPGSALPSSDGAVTGPRPRGQD